MRRTLIIAAALVQLLILGWMAGEREWIVRTSPEVWLRTAPVDPRDLFRGDYVTLGYDISTIPGEKFGPGLKALLDGQSKKQDLHHRPNNREIVIYAALETNPETGTANVSSVDLTPPSSGIFIKGRVRPYGASASSLTGVSYGIDAYYIQQGTGYEYERRRVNGSWNELQTPMDMRVAIANNGTAVLTGHRWGALGISTKIDTITLADGPETGHNMIQVTIGNTGTEARAVVLPADLRTLHIQRMAGWNSMASDASIPRPGLPTLTDNDVRVLKPGESATVTLDPSKCLVQADNMEGPVPLSSLKNDYQYYRVVYTPPTAEESSGLRQKDLITRETLPGRQFGTYEITH